jgi:hypothetical protein
MTGLGTGRIPKDAADLATEAYVAGYPLVVSIRTFQRLAGLLGVNSLVWQPALAGPGRGVVVAPNRDTIYSIAVLDLRSEPLLLTLPDLPDRYHSFQLLDTWTDSFAYLGTRATRGRAGTWAITGPGWEGGLPPGVPPLASPTDQLFLLGRFLVDDEVDIANVLALRQRVSLVPLSSAAGTAPPDPPVIAAPAGRPQDVPTDASFFEELGAALALNPPTTAWQQALFDAAARIGAAPRPGVAVPPERRRLLDAAAAAGDRQISEAIAAPRSSAGGWSGHGQVGRYGDDIHLRALVARIGWGANVPEESVYPITRSDADGRPLVGSRSYRLRFAAGEPPVDAFWSLSVYGPDMFFEEHPSGRYSISDRTAGLAYDDDGGVEIVLAHDEPGRQTHGAANWLPVPRGPFVLMLRLYLPRPEALDGTFLCPPVQALPHVAAGEVAR